MGSCTDLWGVWSILWPVHRCCKHSVVVLLPQLLSATREILYPTAWTAPSPRSTSSSGTGCPTIHQCDRLQPRGRQHSVGHHVYTKRNIPPHISWSQLSAAASPSHPTRLTAQCKKVPWSSEICTFPQVHPGWVGTRPREWVHLFWSHHVGPRSKGLHVSGQGIRTAVPALSRRTSDLHHQRSAVCTPNPVSKRKWAVLLEEYNPVPFHLPDHRRGSLWHKFALPCHLDWVTHSILPHPRHTATHGGVDLLPGL